MIINSLLVGRVRGVSETAGVQVSGAKGVVLIARFLRSGETVGVEGARPLRLRVGNAAGTEARWLGRVVPLEDVQRNNVADVELP